MDATQIKNTVLDAPLKTRKNRTGISLLACIFLSLPICIVGNASAEPSGKATKENGLPLEEKVLAMVRHFHAASAISTITASCSVETKGKTDGAWKPAGRHKFSLDVKNGKSRYFTYANDGNALSEAMGSSLVETREYFCEAGKETLIWGVLKNTGEKRFTNNTWTQKSVTVNKGDGLQTGSSLDFLKVSSLKHKSLLARETPFDFFSKDVRWEMGTTTWTAKIVTKLNDGYSICDSYSFDVKTGRFVEGKSEALNTKGEVTGQLYRFEVPAGKYYCQNGTYFPKEVIHHYNMTGVMNRSIRYIFDDDIKINEAIPASYFVPKIKNGVHVFDAMANKSYRHISKDPAEAEAESVKRLDEIFEEETKGND